MLDSACGSQMVVQLILVIDVLSRLAPVPDRDELPVCVRVVRGRYVREFLRCREQANRASQGLQFWEDLSATSLVLYTDLSNVLNELVVDLAERICQRLNQ